LSKEEIVFSLALKEEREIVYDITNPQEDPAREN